MLCGRQLESVCLHVIIHRKEIQARIANLKRAETLLSCYCIIREMDGWTRLPIHSYSISTTWMDSLVLYILSRIRDLGD
jgi:hypothetical protein